MGTTVERVISLLDSFRPSDDEVETVRRLNEVFDGFEDLADRRSAIPAIVGLIERYPEAEMGNPGPLVHELEALPDYETFVRDSLRRQPALVSLCLANRIVNVDEEQREQWLRELQAVLEHPKASASLREEALHILTEAGSTHG